MLPYTQIAEFIVPNLSVPDIHAFTTTRLLPNISGPIKPSGWPQAAHPRGNHIEKRFAEQGSPLISFLPAPPLWLHQTHGTAVLDADNADIEKTRTHPPTADAAVTHEKNTVLAILTADCLPTILVDQKSGAIAIAHAGWRGLAAGILENTVNTMSATAEYLTAWLGPAIGNKAFEVGEDVYRAFNAAKDAEAASCFQATNPGHWLADLYALARLKLKRLGVARISGGEYCTYSDPQRFYSHRRQHDHERMATFVWRA